MVESSANEGSDDLTGVFPVSASSVEHHLVDGKTSVDEEEEDRLGITLVDVVLGHQGAKVSFLVQDRDPVDYDVLQVVVEEHNTVLAIRVDLTAQFVGAVVIAVVNVAFGLFLVYLCKKELVNDLNEDIKCVSIVDVECGTVDIDALTKLFNGNFGERSLFKHLEENLLDSSLGTDSPLIRFTL